MTKKKPIKYHKQDIMDKVSINCQDFRIAQGVTQGDVAREVQCSIENVSAFENSRNDNYIILLWYLNHGMSISELLKGVDLCQQK